MTSNIFCLALSFAHSFASPKFRALFRLALSSAHSSAPPKFRALFRSPKFRALFRLAQAPPKKNVRSESLRSGRFSNNNQRFQKARPRRRTPTLAALATRCAYLTSTVSTPNVVPFDAAFLPTISTSSVPAFAACVVGIAGFTTLRSTPVGMKKSIGPPIFVPFQ